jgi:iron complex outermembrane receptor protein
MIIITALAIKASHFYICSRRVALTLLPVLLCMTVLHGSAALAETGKHPGTAILETEDDYVGDIDTVISATRIRQPLTESPASITVIDRNMIEASGAVEIADVLRLVPGMQVAYPQGNQIAATYHGFADSFPRSMQVLIDGRSIYQASYADIDWLFLGVAMEDIERIEVIRGPNSPLYGSNAVRGVINIITRQPYQDPGTYTRVTAGDLNTRNAVVRHGNRAGELDYRVTLGYQESDGLEGNLDSTNDDRSISSISARGIWHPLPSDEIDLQLGYSDGSLGAGAEPTHDPPPHDRDVQSSYQSIRWRRALEDTSDVSVQFYHNAYSSDDNYRDLLSHAFEIDNPDIVVPFILDGREDQVAGFGLYDYESDRYDLEIQYTAPLSGRLNSVIGAGIRVDRLRSEVITDNDDWIDDWSERVFLNLGYRASDQLLLNLGAMAEHTDEHGAYLSPRLAVNWLFNSDHSIRASYSRAKRNPSLVETHFEQVFSLDDGTDYVITRSSDDPGPETLEAAELGYIGYWYQRRLMLDLKLFRERTDDLIHAVSNKDAEQPFPNVPAERFFLMNDGHVITTGAELMLKYQTGPRDFISLSYANLDTDVRIHRNIYPISGFPLRIRPGQDNTVPKHTLALLASKALPHGFEASAAFYRISQMEWLSDGDDIDGYSRVDARIARHWKAGGSRMQLEGIVQNIGGDYATFRNENIFDTRAYVRFSIAFQ